MEYPLFDFKDFSDFSDFDFFDDDNDIMVNETATSFSRGIEDIGSASGSNGNQPVIDEPNSNQVLPAPVNELHESPSTPKPSQVDVGVELPPPLETTNEQTQPDPTQVDVRVELPPPLAETNEQTQPDPTQVDVGVELPPPLAETNEQTQPDPTQVDVGVELPPPLAETDEQTQSDPTQVDVGVELPPPLAETDEQTQSDPTQVDVGVELPPPLAETNEQTQPDPTQVDVGVELPPPLAETNERTQPDPTQVDVGVELPPPLGTTNEQTQPDPTQVDAGVELPPPLATTSEQTQLDPTQVDVGVELPPPLARTNDQTQLDPMNADLNTFGEVPLDQLIASPDLPNESFLHGWSTDSNLERPISLGFEGNNPSLGNGDNDAYQTTSPPFSPLIMERTNSFPLPLEEMLPKDGVYRIEPVYSERRVNSVQANQFNSHNGSSLPEDGVYTAQPVYSERRVNLVEANNLNSHTGSSHPENGVYTAKPMYLERRVNPVQVNKLNGHVGSSLQDELLSCSPQWEDLVNPGRRVTFADQFQQNNRNNNSNGNQQPLAYPNSTPQSLTGVGLLPGRSTQINRQAPTWNSYRANDFYRPLAPSGSQADEFQSIGNSYSQHYNFIQPRSSALLRSQQQLNNPSQLFNQVPNRPNASDSLLQYSMLTKHSMPSQFLSQNFSYQQHDQVSMIHGAYNPLTYSNRFTESSMPLRTSTLAPNRQTNPLDVSDLRYRNCLQARSSMFSNASGRYNFQDLNDYRDHQIDQFNLMATQLDSQVSNSMLLDSRMHSGSYQFPCHQQASSQFSMPGLSKLPHHQQACSQFSMPCFSNADLYNFKLSERSILQRLQQQQGLLNQSARSIPTFPISGTGTGTGTGTSLPNIVFNSLLQNETGDTSTSHQVGTPKRNNRKRRASRRRRSPPARTKYGSGESSSSFKRSRREPSILPMPQRDPSTLPMPMPMPMPIPVPNAELENRNLLSMHNGTNTSSNASNLSGPRPIKNSLYDPLFEGIGLPVDPHLRMFATM